MKSRSFNLLVILALFLSLLGSAVIFTPAYAAGIVVNTAVDEDTNNANCSLREAIIAANTDAAYNGCSAGAGTDTITFAADYTITLAGSQLPPITTQMTITGNGATKTIIQASTCNPVTLPGGCTPATNRVFIINSGSNATLNDMTVRHGDCTSCVTGGTEGGGIRNDGTLTINNSSISDNKATTGGGIRNNNTGTLTVTDSTLSGNKAVAGGGIYNIGTMTVANSTFFDNKTTDPAFGGAGFYQAGVTTVTNSTFFNNTASGRGGAVFLDGPGSATIKNSTLSNNSAGVAGGGIFLHTSLTLINTIIANSISGGDCTNFGFVVTNINTIIEDGTCNVGTTTLQNFKAGDPNLGSLADNGGPTQTMALQTGSIAIDAGDAATCAAAPVSNKDQRGVTRPQGAVCDIGAYEVDGGIPVVTASNPSANAVLTSLSSITVVFNQDMLNDSSAKAANNPVNYLLVERGANGNFDTVSCNGGVVSDDVQKTISTANYSNAGFITTLTLASPLANGTYRLFVCGTTSVWSVAGIELNNGVSDYTVDFTITSSGATGDASSTKTTASSLPKTGFAPNKITTLPAQPADSAYTTLGDLWLEIPSLNVKSTIVGVPQAENAWDVKWLGNDAGWLNGTAFPSWEGNSVITGHVTNASGLPGPFASIKSLQHGDQIIIHMSGMKYIFEVRNTKLVRPDTTAFAFEHLEGSSYITLITCSGYNPLNDSYLFRRIVRAVLVSTENE
ncbi:MAG: sortase [Anaerolineales bacterium]